mgnify:CR=1 FL=1
MSRSVTSEALLKIIRDHCLECSGGSRFEVHHCKVTDCRLYPFRKGEERPKERKNKKDRQISLFEVMKEIETGKNHKKKGR